jgi:hypothetical protein
VEAPLAEAAEVLALSSVPEEMLEALIPVIAVALPEILVNAPVVAETFVELTSVAVTTFAVNEPLESRVTMVEALLAELAVVLPLSKVPLVMFDALIAVSAMPFPETPSKDPVVAETFVAVTTLPAKEPFASRNTIVLALLAESAVVNALPIVPLEILEALMLVSEAPLPEMLALIVPVTVTLLAKVAF